MSTGTDARADGDAEGAKKHFEVGRKLRDEGDCAKAIPEFEQSIAADKSIGGYYNLGFCQEQLGLRQEAYDAYRRGKEMASVKKDERLKEISGALAALLETPNVRLVLPQPIPNGMRITVDGVAVPPSAYLNETVVFTRPMPVHDVRVIAPGYDELGVKVESRELKAIELKVASAAGPKRLPPPPPTTTHWSTQHWAGLGVIVTGGVFVTLGSVMYLSYTIDQSTNLKAFENATSACANPKAPDACLVQRDADGQPSRNAQNQVISKAELERANRKTDTGNRYNNREDRATEDAPIMLGAFIGGLLAVGGGIALLLTAKRVPDQPNAEKRSALELRTLPVVTPVVSPTFQGVSILGTF